MAFPEIFGGIIGSSCDFFRMTWRIRDVFSHQAKLQIEFHLQFANCMFPIPALQNLAGHCMMPRGSKRPNNKTKTMSCPNIAVFEAV